MCPVFFPAGGKGDMQLVQHVDVTSNTTSVSFTGLNINADGYYVLMGGGRNETGNVVIYKIYANNDTTDTNYYSQKFQAGGTDLFYNRQNLPLFSRVGIGEHASFFSLIYLDPEQHMRSLTHTSTGTPSSMYLIYYYATSVSTFTNITRIDITADQTDGIRAGSWFTLYKLVKS